MNELDIFKFIIDDMTPETKRKFFIDMVDELKIQKKQEYSRSYTYISEIFSDLFNENLRKRNLTENKRLVDLIESHKSKICKLHQSILLSIDDYANIEKENINLMTEKQLNDIHLKGPHGFEKCIEKALDIALYEASNKAHVNFEIDNILQRIQLENLILST